MVEIAIKYALAGDLEGLVRVMPCLTNREVGEFHKELDRLGLKERYTMLTQEYTKEEGR